MLTIQQKTKVENYASLKMRIKELEAEADALNPEVLEIMKANKAEEIEIGDMGKVSLASRRTWKYSEATQNLDKKLKETRKFEEQTGVADYSERHYIVFKRLGERDE